MVWNRSDKLELYIALFLSLTLTLSLFIGSCCCCSWHYLMLANLSLNVGQSQLLIEFCTVRGHCWTRPKLGHAGGTGTGKTTYRRKLQTCLACCVYVLRSNRRVPVCVCVCVLCVVFVFVFCVFECARVRSKLLFSLANQNKMAKYVEHFRRNIQRASKALMS